MGHHTSSSTAARLARASRIALFLSLSSFGATLHAQRTQLSAPLEQVVAGRVLEQRVSADGSFLVYAADPLANDRIRLTRAELAGPGATLDLGVELRTIGGPALRFAIDPSGARVVFLTLGEEGGAELFSVPSDGSGPAVRLDRELPAGGTVHAFGIAPDGLRVVYTAEQEAAGPTELYSVPIQGGPSAKINAPLTASGTVLDFQIAPDARTVLYRARGEQGGRELFAGRVSGRQPAWRLSPVHPSGRDVTQFALSASRLEVVYRSDLRIDGRHELYAVPLLGGVPRVVNQPVRGAGVEEFLLTPDGKRVVYNAHTTTTPGLQLFAVPLQGGEPVRLDPGLPGSVREFRVDALGRRVAFHLRRDPLELSQLLSAPLDGSQPAVRIDQDDVPGVPPAEDAFHLTPDGTRVVYHEGSPFALRVYVVPLDASTPPLRLGSPAPLEQLAGIDAASRHVVYGLTSFRLDGVGGPLFLGGGVLESARAGEVEGSLAFHPVTFENVEYSRTDLYRVPVDGSAPPVRINPPFPLGPTFEDVTEFTPAAAANRGAYLVTGGRLFGVTLDGSEMAVAISDPASGPVLEVSTVVSPDGRWVAYAQASAVLLAELDGSQPPVPVAAPAFPVAMTPDGARLLYTVQDGGGYFLDSLPLDGSAPAARLGGPLAPTSSFTTDSVHVLFEVDLGDSVWLFSAPVDGSAPALDLGVRPSFRAAPLLSLDGRYVVCRGVSQADPMNEGLFSIDLQGSATPVRLNDLPFAGSSPALVDPSSRFVVYLAQDGALLSLRRVAIAGGEASVPLLDSYAGLAIDRLALAADGEHVLLAHDAQVIEFQGSITLYDFDVLAVPIDGSQAVVPLNEERAGPGTTTFSHLGPSLFLPLFAGPAERVVFPEGPRLVSAALDGGARVELTQALGATVQELLFSPDGRLAVFELPLAGGTGLYEAATDGSQPLRLLSGQALPGSQIVAPCSRFCRPAFAVSADGAFAAYLGDLDELGAHELFASPLGAAQRLADGPGQTRRR